MVRSAMEPETMVAAVAQNTVWNTMYTHRGISLSLIHSLEKKEEELKKRAAEAEERLAEIDALRAKEMERLETLAGLSQEDARAVLLHNVDEEQMCIRDSHYIEQNGYVESKAVLMKPPFDQPILFTRLFDGKMGGELMETIDAVRENAVHVLSLIHI